MKKGDQLVFKHGTETIKSVSMNRERGNVVTNKQTYSTDFIMRCIEFGFVKVIKNTDAK